MGQIPENTVEMCSDNSQCKHDFNDKETNAYSGYGKQCSKCFCYKSYTSFSGGGNRRKSKKRRTRSRK